MNKARSKKIWGMCEDFCRARGIEQHTRKLYNMAIQSYHATPHNERADWNLSKV